MTPRETKVCHMSLILILLTILSRTYQLRAHHLISGGMEVLWKKKNQNKTKQIFTRYEAKQKFTNLGRKKDKHFNPTPKFGGEMLIFELKKKKNFIHLKSREEKKTLRRLGRRFFFLPYPNFHAPLKIKWCAPYTYWTNPLTGGSNLLVLPCSSDHFKSCVSDICLDSYKIVKIEKLFVWFSGWTHLRCERTTALL